MAVKYQSEHRWPRAIKFNPHHLVLWSFLGLSQWVYVRVDMSKRLKIMSLGVINHGMSLSVLYHGGQFYWWRNPSTRWKPPTCRKSIAGGWTYVIIEHHFVLLEGKFLLISLVIVRITSNVIGHQIPLNNGVFIAQKLVVKLSNT